MNWALADARGAIRLLIRGRLVPRSAAVLAVIAIALTGVSLALFQRVVLQPLPFAEPSRLVILESVHLSYPSRGQSPSPADVWDWQSRARTISGAAIWLDQSRLFMTARGPVELRYGNTSENLFQVLGVRPERGVLPGSVAAGSIAEAAVTHDFWRSYLSGDAGVLDSVIDATALRFVVRAVLPPDFRIPGVAVDIWSPFRFTGLGDRGARAYLHVVARLAPGFTIRDARTDLDRIARELEQEYPGINRDWRVRVTSADEYFRGASRRAVSVLAAVVLLTLLLAAGTLASLFVSRSIDRTPELRARASLGAGPARLAGQLAVEALVFCALVGVAALVVVAAAIPALDPLVRGAGLPRPDASMALAGSAGAVVLLALVTAGAPSSWALLVGRETGRASLVSVRAPKRRALVSRSLLTFQVSASFALVFVATTVGVAMVRLFGIRPGFEPEGVVTAKVTMVVRDHPSPARRVAQFERVVAGVNAMPSVASAGFVSMVPFGDPLLDFEVRYRPDPVAAGDTLRVASYRVVTPGFFDAMRIPVHAGRVLDVRDDSRGERVVIVNEALARSVWPGESAIGRRLLLHYVTDELRTVTGVVGNTLDRELTEDPMPRVYVPLAQAGYVFNEMMLVALSRDSRGFVQRLRTVVDSLNPSAPAYDVRRLESRMSDSLIREQLVAWVAVFLAGLGLLVSSFAVYGLLSYYVTTRGRDLALRIALGARVPILLMRTSADLFALTGIGAVIGALVTVGLDRLIRAFVPVSGGLEVIAAVIAVASIGAAALLGAALPFLRVWQTSPAALLRSN